MPLEILQKGSPHGAVYVFFHAISGGVSCYQALIGSLGPKINAFGLTATGRNSDDIPVDSIVEQVDQHMAHLSTLELASSGICLVGWCMGGLLAQHIAARLERKGVTCRLVLIDTNLVLETCPSRAPELERLYWHSLSEIVTGSTATAQRENFWTLSDSEKRNEISAAALSFRKPTLSNLLRVFDANWRATQTFSPLHFHGPSLFFEAEDTPYAEAAARWSGYCHSLQIARVTGATHRSVIEDPFVRQITDSLTH